MAGGNPANIRDWEWGMVYAFDPDVTFVEATHVPGDIDDELHASWLECGLMLGTPGVAMARQIERTDVNSWQQGRVKEKTKNPKTDITFTLLEDNEITDYLQGEASVPGVKKLYLALVFKEADTGYVKRFISKTKVGLFAASNNYSQDIEGTEYTGALEPVSGEYWIVQKGIPA